LAGSAARVPPVAAFPVTDLSAAAAKDSISSGRGSRPNSMAAHKKPTPYRSDRSVRRPFLDSGASCRGTGLSLRIARARPAGPLRTACWKSMSLTPPSPVTSTLPPCRSPWI